MSKPPHSSISPYQQRDWQPFLRGLGLLLIFDVVFILCFWGAGEAASQRGWVINQSLPIESQIPFLPEWVLIYNSIWILGTFVFLQRPTPADLRPILWALLVEIGIAIPVFVLFPTGNVFSRGELPAGWIGKLYQITDRTNLQLNGFPSLHVALAITFAAAGASRLRSAWGQVLLWVWAALACASTVLIHEHHLADAAAGAVVAWIGIRFVMRPLQSGRPPLGLRYSSDLRSLGLLWILGMCLLLLWTGWFRSGWLLALALPLAFSACSIAHNHIHLPMFRARRANSVFSCLLGFFCGQPPCAIVDAHTVRHHGMLGSEADYVRPSIARFRWNWLNVFAFPLIAMFEMFRAKARRGGNSAPLSRQTLAERTIFILGVAALLVAKPSDTLLFIFAPWFFGQFCIVGINIIQHQGCEPDSPWNHSRNVTGAAINWLMLNGGFHTAHHLRPGLHWSLLPEFHRREVIPRIDRHLNQRSLGAAIITRMRAPSPAAPNQPAGNQSCSQ